MRRDDLPMSALRRAAARRRAYFTADSAQIVTSNLGSVGVAAAMTLALVTLLSAVARATYPPWEATAAHAAAFVASAAVLAASLLLRRRLSARPVASTAVCLAAEAALLALVTAGCLSPRLAATEPLPFFALAASSRLLGQAARFDAVLSTAVAAALYCALASLGSFTHCLTKKKSAAAIFTFYALLFLAACLVQVIPIGAVVLYLVVFWGIIPICLIVLEKAKNGENSRKRY